MKREMEIGLEDIIEIKGKNTKAVDIGLSSSTPYISIYRGEGNQFYLITKDSPVSSREYVGIPISEKFKKQLIKELKPYRDKLKWVDLLLHNIEIEYEEMSLEEAFTPPHDRCQ